MKVCNRCDQGDYSSACTCVNYDKMTVRLIKLEESVRVMREALERMKCECTELCDCTTALRVIAKQVIKQVDESLKREVTP